MKLLKRGEVCKIQKKDLLGGTTINPGGPLNIYYMGSG
jgi:hypothetical protein